MTDQREPAKKQRRLTDLWSGASKATVDSGGDHCVETEYGSAPSAVPELPVQLPLPVQPRTSTTVSTQPTEVGQKPCSSSSNSCPSVTAAHNDIGLAVGQTLNDEVRARFLKPWKPSSEEEYPSSERRDKKSITKDGVQRRRRLLPHHLETFSWLAVSKVMNGAFCVPCVLFSSNVGVGGRSQGQGQQSGILVRRPLTRFEDLTSKDGVLLSHQNTVYHKNATIAYDNFKLALF